MKARLLFSVYSWLAPLVFTPLAIFLWSRETGGNAYLTLIVCALPIAWAYIVPGIGTNVMKMWEFDVRLRLGRFRIQHGFVFGSATAMIAWLTHSHLAHDIYSVLQYSFVLASVLGFWNLIYDIVAIDAGVLKVYNQPWSEGKAPSAIAMDYAPWFFAGFGVVYGAVVGLSSVYTDAIDSWAKSCAVLIAGIVAACALPTLSYMIYSFRRYGHTGTKPFVKVETSNVREAS